jgi:hypothetical protein
MGEIEMARPTRLNEEKMLQIAQLISAGNFAEVAAQASGISKATYYNWIVRGKTERDRMEVENKANPKASERPYVEFMDAIEKARAEAEARMILVIGKAANDTKSWQAAAWWLERVFPQKYGKITRTEISGPEGAPIQSETKQIALSEAEIVALADEILGYKQITIKKEED